MASRNSSAPLSPSPSPSLLQSIQASPRKIDISQVKGNVSAQEKQRSWDVFSYFVSTKEGSYGAEVGQRIKLVEINVWGVPDNGEDSARATPEEADLRLRKSGLVAAESGGDAAYGQTVFEILVERDMCNVFGTLHGGCAAYIVDPCSVSSLIALGSRLGIDATGVSQSMNLQWHNPVKVGTKLRIISTTVCVQGRMRTARCELWDGDRLCVSAVHTTTNPWASRNSKRQRKDSGGSGAGLVKGRL